ncbi:MAG: hypothetical protein NWQ28_01005 [Nodularia sp. (in: cyanobacteria)]|nr:hypothetical protein [Nodularia sp. (in: cyanobacteria)]
MITNSVHTSNQQRPEFNRDRIHPDKSITYPHIRQILITKGLFLRYSIAKLAF